MVRRFLAAFWCVIAALLIAGPASAQQPQRIVAVGDLHGDYDAWIAIARGAGVVDARNRWAGGTTTLVQTGDITDRGPDSLKIIRHLQQLDKEASGAGGKVVVLLGNHEAMNVTGDLRYVDPGEYRAFADRNSKARREAVYNANVAAIEAAYRARDPSLDSKAVRTAWLDATPLGMIEHQAAWAPAGELGRWAASLPAVVKIGDTLFAHGGLSAPYTAMGGLAEINRRVRAALLAGDKSPASILGDPLGPLWYRGLVTRGAAFEQEVAAAAAASGTPVRPRPPIDQELDLVLTAFGARRLVIGHTPNPAGIVISHGGKLARIDTGISRYYKGQLSWLEINGGQLTPRSIPRSGQ
jgi:Calcineurin-like phosphoesterase